jgi:hypothetical protein
MEALLEIGDRMARAVQARWSGPGGCDCACCTAAREWIEAREESCPLHETPSETCVACGEPT